MTTDFSPDAVTRRAFHTESLKGKTNDSVGVHTHQVLPVLIITVRTSDAEVNLSAFKFISVESKNILFIVTPGREGEDECSFLGYLR